MARVVISVIKAWTPSPALSKYSLPSHAGEEAGLNTGTQARYCLAHQCSQSPQTLARLTAALEEVWGGQTITLFVGKEGKEQAVTMSLKGTTQDFTVGEGQKKQTYNLMQEYARFFLQGLGVSAKTIKSREFEEDETTSLLNRAAHFFDDVRTYARQVEEMDKFYG